MREVSESGDDSIFADGMEINNIIIEREKSIL